MATYYGTTGSDTIIGSSSPDNIYGYPQGSFPENEFGDDILRGGGGNDNIYGGGGNDTLYGDEGGDDLYGGDGNDTLHGGQGNDRFDGGAGDDIFVITDNLQDVFLGGLGTDTIRLENFIFNQKFILNAQSSVEVLDLGSFTLSGTQFGDDFDFSSLTSIINGSDRVIDLGAGADTFIGHAGADFVRGGSGDDTLRGGGGNDVLSGGSGSDHFDGGTGDDTFLIDGTDSDTFQGGDGVDTVRLEGATVRYRLILDATTGVEVFDRAGQSLNGSSTDNIFDFSGLSAFVNSGPVIDLGLGDDLYIGYHGDDAVLGGGGNDRLVGGTGNDMLDGGTGADTLEGGAGNDTYVVDSKSDKVIELARGGTDHVKTSVNHTLSDHVEKLTVIGTANVTANGNGLANTITGNAGKNTLGGGGGNDVIKSGSGNDTLIGGLGADDLYSGSGKDIIAFKSVRESTVSPGGRDTVFDFSKSDLVDLRAIDAKSGTARNDSFTFIGTQKFSKTAGELRFEKKASDVYVYGDVNGDGKADFAIHFDGLGAIGKGDFLL